MTLLGGALAAQVAANVFQSLHVGATLFDGDDWHSIYSIPSEPWNTVSFEYAFGKELERDAYNIRLVERAQREGKIVRGEHAGFFDYFVPVDSGSKKAAVLISGPFLVARPTSEQMLERWRKLTGRQGHPSDSQFAHYIQVTLGTLLLDGGLDRAYQRLLACYADLVSGRGNHEELSQQVEALKNQLATSRSVEKVWETARSMVDRRSGHQWSSPGLKGHLNDVNVTKAIEHVLVGFFSNRREDLEPVEGILQRYAFQRAIVSVAEKRGNFLCGPVGDHGVVLLLGGVRGIRARAAVEQVAHSMATLARRRFGLGVHFGASIASDAFALPDRYEQALATAERALWEGRSFLHADPGVRPVRSSIRRARRNLILVAEERPKAVEAEFERYLETVAMSSAYRVEAARAHLEAGFDQLAQKLLSKASIDERGYDDIWQQLEGSVVEANTIDALSVAYRFAISELVELVEKPARAAQDRSLRRAVAFMHAHFADPITLTQVARVAGFAREYFCRLFKKREGTTFEAYLRQLRVARAKDLLTGTDLGIERVAQLAGFSLRSHFHRVFREAMGTTPLDYRLNAAAGSGKRKKKRARAKQVA